MSAASDEAAVGVVKVSADRKAWHDVSALVSSIDVEDHEHLTDKVVIVLDDHAGVLAHASFVSLRVRVALGWNLERVTIFEGLVTEGRSVTQQRGPQYELTALDFTHVMSTVVPKEPKLWPGDGEGSLTLKQVVETILTKDDYTPYSVVPHQIEPLPDPIFTSERRLTQTESDWDFLQRLARDYNCRAFIEYNGEEGPDDTSPNAASNFSFVPIAMLARDNPIGALTCCRGRGDLISFDYNRIGSGSLVETTATVVDPATGKPETTPPPPAAPVPPLPAAATDREPDLSKERAAAVQALTELSAAADKELAVTKKRAAAVAADPAAAVQLVVPDPTRVAGMSGSGVAIGTVMMRAKSRVSIYGIAPWAEGEWYVTKVNHVYGRQQLGERRMTTYVSNFKATR